MSKPREVPHPSDHEMFLAMEGELPGRQQKRIREHIATCWRCRPRAARMERRIGDFMLAHSRQGERVQPSDAARLRFLRAVQQQAQATGHATGPRESFWRLAADLAKDLAKRAAARTYVAASLFATGLIVALLYLSNPTQAVSAEELLDRAAKTESATKGHRQKIRIRAGTWETTREVAKPAVHRPAKDASPPATVLESLRRSHVDLDDPLSASDFRAWRSELPSHRDQVRSVKGNLQLTTTATDGLVTRASLTVREDTFRPVRRDLTLNDGQRIEVEELSFEPLVEPSLPVTKLPVSVPDPRPAVTSTSILPVPAPSPGVEALANAEVAARYELFRLGAAAAEIPRITRSAGEIVVTAAANGSHELDRIASALKEIPYVRVEFGDALRATEDAWQSATPVSPREAAERARAPLEQVLDAALPGKAQRERFVADVVGAGQEALERAAALKDLAERYRDSEYALLSQMSRERLSTMIEAHLAAIETGRSTVAAVLTVAGWKELQDEDLPDEEEQAESWQSGAARLYLAVRRAQERTVWLITSGAARPEDAEQLLGQLQRALADWKIAAGSVAGLHP